MKVNELYTTSDGSHSLLSSEFEVSYHSRHGAIGETQHVFIDAGLKPKLDLSNISVLDIGFGTGLNALMTLKESKSSDSAFYYEAIEAFPIALSSVPDFNYPIQLEMKSKSFSELHTSEWDVEIVLSDNFTFQKKLAKFEDFVSEHNFDIVYYDAFAPNAQPELWETEILSKMFNLLNEDGVLVTYCAQGQFKRNLKAAGFILEPLPGPVGKREMTRARKTTS